jgi:LPS-assembly protein
MTTHMIARTTARACLGAALICPPWLAAHAADSACSADSGTGYTAPTPIRLAALATPADLDATDLKGPIDYSSAQGVADTAARTLELSGDVSVHIGDREILADKATVDETSRSVHAEGSVRYTDSLVHVQGDSGFYSTEHAQFSNAQFNFLKRPGRGSAKSVELMPGGKLKLHDVTYTSCPPGRHDWQLKAREIDLDTNADRGVGHDTVVDFKGVPLIWLPWLSFPMSSSRQTGFLFPNFGSSSQNGLFLSVPWYWNIAPTSDLTLTPTLYTNRGIDTGVEYRVLSASNSGTFQLNYLPHDREYGAERSFESAQDRLNLPNNWRLDVHAQNVSDTEYFEDFGQTTQITSTIFLSRLASIQHRDDIWNVTAELQNFQTLDQTLPVNDYPYTQLPRISADALWHLPALAGLAAGFDSEIVYFTRNDTFAHQSAFTQLYPYASADAVTGWRLNARPELSYDLTLPGYFLRPSIAWDLTQYALSDADGANSAPQRSLPLIVVDSGMQFERTSGSGGLQNVTLEPRVMYVYIPYRDQSQLPIFDTSTPDQNTIELFQPNRYVGLDRIGDANALTVGLTTNLFASTTGMRYLSATVGQSFYLQPPRVTLPYETLASETTSGLVGEIDLTAYRNWNLQVQTASTPNLKAVDKAEVNLQYRASSSQVANVGFVYQRGSGAIAIPTPCITECAASTNPGLCESECSASAAIQQVEQMNASFAWPVNRHWDAYAGAAYSIVDHTAIQNFLGVQFHGDCWGFRAVAQRSVTNQTGQRDTGVYLQLELNGLSNVGSGVDAFLKQGIRGYSSTPISPTSP